MKIISYDPARDELVLMFQPVRGKPNAKFGRFKLWWDEQRNIRGLTVSHFTEEVKEFKKNLGAVRLGGIWKGIEITEEDISKTRRALLKKLEKKW